MGNPDLPAYGAGPSTIAMAVVFGAIIVATAAMTMQSWLVHDTRGEKNMCWVPVWSVC